ncbi:glycosyltransferase family 2 protein [Parasediminibacterium paludis]|uniref:Glycosyltransferase family 2 protein n=1 Tax=Parasediminibacterium paludis TaxID=908966 RepID=A0ABV8PTY1_9BACT
MPKKISIVIPVCNEKGNIPTMVKALQEVMYPLPYTYTITYIDDGSDDDTLDRIKIFAKQYENIFFISFSRNFGHQNALKAGFDFSDGDAVITMDGDLQHPPELIPILIEQWEQGNDIVYTIRNDHQEMPLMKRKTSTLFYNILNRLSDIELESGTADFRLMDKRVVEIFRGFKEADLFWRGLVKWLGFKQVGIEYEPAERKEGKSKYTYKKMMQLALRGITSFSLKPLAIATYLGFTFSLLSLLYIPYVIYSLAFGHPISGWASMIVTIAFFGGLQLMILGIIGMYLGKLFMQSKERPHYIIKESNL